MADKLDGNLASGYRRAEQQQRWRLHLGGEHCSLEIPQIYLQKSRWFRKHIIQSIVNSVIKCNTLNEIMIIMNGKRHGTHIMPSFESPRSPPQPKGKIADQVRSQTVRFSVAWRRNSRCLSKMDVIVACRSL